VIREFQDDPRVVTLPFQEGGRMQEELPWVKTFWENYYLREDVIFDTDGSSGKFYQQPQTGLPFGRGFIIDRQGKVALPYFGYDSRLAIETIYSLLASIRGDANGDGALDISDALQILFHLFAGIPVSSPDAVDVNADGEKNVTDVIYLLAYLFRGGPEPPR